MSVTAKLRLFTSPILFLLLVLFGTQNGQMAQTSSVSELLVQLRSEDWQRRSDALERVLAMPESLRSAEVRKSLIDLLDDENRRIDGALRESDGRSGASVKYGEGYSEYYSALLGAVSTLEDTRALRVLARSSYNPGSAIAKKLAENWEIAGPVMVDLTQSDIAVRRNSAYGVLTNILKAPQITRDLQMSLKPDVDNRISFWRTANSSRLNAAINAADVSESQKGKLIGSVEPLIQQNSVEWGNWVLDTVRMEDLKAKKDQDVIARLQTIRLLGLVGNNNTVLLLERIASNGPEAAVKLEARKAIDAIRSRPGRPTEAPR
jgi:hypothetical protein